MLNKEQQPQTNSKLHQIARQEEAEWEIYNTKEYFDLST